MNKSSARRIAETITRDQLLAMFERAKAEISDWTQPSRVNPGFSLGVVWNMTYPLLMEGKGLRPTIITNMIWAFGDYLDESLKPAKVCRPKPPEVYHEQPVFEVGQ